MNEDFVTKEACKLIHARLADKIEMLNTSMINFTKSIDALRIELNSLTSIKAWADVGKWAMVGLTISGTVLGLAKFFK